MTAMSGAQPHPHRRHWTWWQKFAAGAVGLFFAFVALGFSLNAAGYHAPPRPVHVTQQLTPGYVPAHAPGASGLMAISDHLAAQMLAPHYSTGPMRPFTWNGAAYVPAYTVEPGIQYYAGPAEWQWIISHNGK